MRSSGRAPTIRKRIENRLLVRMQQAHITARGKKVCGVFLRCAGEAGERLPLGKSVQFCAYLLFVGALAARLSDG